METTTETFKPDPDLIDRAADRVEANFYGGPDRTEHQPGQVCECAFTSVSVELLELLGKDEYYKRGGTVEDQYMHLFARHWNLTVHGGHAHMAVFRWNDAQPNGKVVADAMRDVATWVRRTQR